LLKGIESFESLDDEVEGWTAREVEATVEAFLTASTAAAPATDVFELRFLTPVLRLTRVDLGCAVVLVEQL
jgi:hypothetical protein